MTEVPPEITALDEAKVKEMRSDLHHLIDKIVERVHYAETRRGAFGTIGAAMVAAGVAILTFAIAQPIQIELRLPGVALGGSLLATGGLIWFMFARQTNRYPFTGATRVWKWHYRDALPDQAAFVMPWYAYLFGWKQLGKRVRQQYDDQLPSFYQRHVLPLADHHVSLWQDVQQVYVLHVNEKYKNIFLNHFRAVVSYGFPAIFIIVTISWLAGALVYERERIHEARLETPDFTVDARWRAAGIFRHDGSSDRAQLLLNLNLENKHPSEMKVGKIFG